MLLKRDGIEQESSCWGVDLQADAAQGAPDTEPYGAALPSVDDHFRCSKGLKVLLLRMTRDPDLAKDLAQDVMESVLLAIRARRVQSVQALPAYVHACARNLVFANARRARRTVLDKSTDMIEADATPLDNYEKRELAALAQIVLAELPTDRDRGLIRGFYIDGQSKQALMQIWQLDRDHFDKVLSRARLRMRELMHEKLNRSTGAVSAIADLRVLPRHGDQ